MPTLSEASSALLLFQIRDNQSQPELEDLPLDPRASSIEDYHATIADLQVESCTENQVASDIGNAM